ncbi:Gfo/Idh/MocA family oxidoreductase [Actinosynnema sp. NPDC047251]|uniref:Oxidoreductase domain-containing protein n=1 Tax=Saccharothrix espanaensis (strain ATCC 51144 / DSM 44229 / JCM 9112 / NBRC 15066 / NRRL 15764) TaxID=1179773 RepID=K0K6N2_SACES|nr:Gfo/Idh/MocA family oxidoreductase [Saccharothrix espanaensis]CCH32554.1 Oxidoreductase domain-containing protein [Saccharothrix espanaensis DSM 44229]
MDKLRVAVVGAGRWARRAHLPGWSRDPRVEVVALVDSDPVALGEAARLFGVGRTFEDYRQVLDDPTVDVVDVATANTAHFEVSAAAIAAGKHVLCEKPVHRDYRETQRLAEAAASRGLKTKLGFTFRYAPAVLHAKSLIDAGFVGTPYLFNGFEQNSQWIDPATPMRQVDPDADPAVIATSSIEGYGAPIIDIMHWWAGARLTSVVGTMRNFVPERVVLATGRSQRLNIDDGDMWICEFDNDLVASIQSSYVAVGALPGIEARFYGSEGAVIVRLAQESGGCQTIRTATKDEPEFVEREIPARFFPPGATSAEAWDSLFYANLCADFTTEILDGGATNQGDFAQGALVQETINAFEASFRRRAWVDLPLGGVA